MSDLHDERRPAAVKSGHCRFCGHPNPAAAKYCNDCGSPLSLRPCALCGAINALGAMRCHACDAALPCATDAEIAREATPSGTPASPAPDVDGRGLPAGVLATSSRVRLQRAWPVLAVAVGVAAVAGYVAYGPAREREAGSPAAVAPQREAQTAGVTGAEDAPRDSRATVASQGTDPRDTPRDGQAAVASQRTDPGDAPPAPALPAPDGAQAATPAVAGATAAATTAAVAATAVAGAPSGVESSAAKQGSPSAAATKRTTGRSTKTPSAQARSKTASSAKKDRPQGTKRAPASKPPRASSAPREGAARPVAGAGKASPAPATEGAAR
jgi:hypothetical protein